MFELAEEGTIARYGAVCTFLHRQGLSQSVSQGGLVATQRSLLHSVRDLVG
jgi:hypothetical protein